MFKWNIVVRSDFVVKHKTLGASEALSFKSYFFGVAQWIF